MNTKKNILYLIIFLTYAHVSLSFAKEENPRNVTKKHMQEVLAIAKKILHIQPRLNYEKVMEYSMGIFAASKKYDIQPDILIAITNQESAFRENLKEGKAGEVGICQIIKSWIYQDSFQQEFGTMTVKELKMPENSFYVAAWILHTLKTNQITYHSNLPYWSYYNSKKYIHRLKYYVRVKRHLASISLAAHTSSSEHNRKLFTSSKRRDLHHLEPLHIKALEASLWP